MIERSAIERRLSGAAISILVAALLLLAFTRIGGAAPAAAAPSLDTLPLAYGPANFASAVALADDAVTLGLERVDRRPQDWLNQESLARALLSRARLTGLFEDLVAAGNALAVGNRLAPAGSGPLLSTAVYQFTVHRSAPILAALDTLDRSAVAADPGDQAEALALRGDVAFYGGDYRQAIDLYGAAHRTAASVGTSLRIAQWQRQTGKPDDALRSIAHAASLNPQRTRKFMADMHLHSGAVEIGRGNWPAAAVHFEKALAVFPGYWLSEAHVAQMEAVRGDVDSARRRYLRIVERTPHPEVIDALAALYRSEGNGAESRRWAARSAAIWAARLAQLPEAAYGHTLEHELALGDPSKALDLARLNVRARPYGESITLLGSALLAAGRPAEARDLIEALNRTEWRSAAQYVVLADARALLGDDDGSQSARDAALKLNPRAFDPASRLIWFGHH